MARPKILPDTPAPGLVSDSGQRDDRVQGHPGYGLTAPRLVAAYRQAENGYPSWQCDLFDDVVESEGHLRSALEGRLLAVAGKPWTIQAGGSANADRKAAELLETALRECPNFLETIVHQLKANWYGWAPSEMQWEYQHGIYAPAWFENVDQRRCIIGDRGEIRLASDRVAANENDGIPLDAGKWWVGRSWPNDRPARGGLLRTASWWALFKRMAVRDWIVFAERFGLPYVTAQWEAGASDEDIKIAKHAARTLGRDGGAAFSSLVKLMIHAVEYGGKAGDVHGAIAALANAEMSKLISGATLMSDPGGQSSYALGQVHADRAFALYAADALHLGMDFAQAVGRPFVAFNKMGARPPILHLDVVPDVAPLTEAQIISILVNNLGVKYSEQQLRAKFFAKTPSSADDELPGQGAPVPVGVGAGT